MTSALAPPLATPEALSTPQTAVTLHGATAEKATKEETAASTKAEEKSALGAAKNEAGNVSIAMPPPPPPLPRAGALLDSSQGSLVPKDSEHSDPAPSAWNRRVRRRKERQKTQSKEKPHVPRESSVEDSSQRRHQPLNIATVSYTHLTLPTILRV